MIWGMQDCMSGLHVILLALESRPEQPESQLFPHSPLDNLVDECKYIIYTNTSGLKIDIVLLIDNMSLVRNTFEVFFVPRYQYFLLELLISFYAARYVVPFLSWPHQHHRRSHYGQGPLSYHPVDPTYQNFATKSLPVTEKWICLVRKTMIMIVRRYIDVTKIMKSVVYTYTSQINPSGVVILKSAF